ncbi:Multiple sugar-binding protein [Blautia producta]|uniref:Multiple sugar-binding protein n=1 Tax=Blautia producta TaxID=33035 RepID=A0A4P6LZG0_9FIRM|nr:ABC transporter substrate-binding protein [Blautia producta]QBE98131.1 Multiple sugar-binding protein [Blautia producta]
MKKRKQPLLLAVTLMGICALVGCGERNTVTNYQDLPEDITSITFFGNKYEPENVTVIEEIISGFMDENPDIRVSYESLKGNEYFEALHKRMDAGKGDDVFMVNHDIVLELEEEGKLAELSDLDIIADYTDAMLSQMEDNGDIYWVPTTVSAFGLYCNQNLLRDHEQEIPENLAQWEQVCDYFVKEGITPVIANNDISLKTLAIGKGFYSVYQEDSQREVFAQLNEGKEMLSKYLYPGFSLAEDFIAKGYVSAADTLETNKTSDDLDKFVKGDSPFMLTGAWAAGRVKSMEPDFEFEVVPYPVLEDGSLLVINADTRLSVNADSEHMAASLKFVEYFTRPDNVQKFADQQSSFNPLNNGSPSSVQEIQPLVSCYQSGRTVIGTDGLLELPIWEWTKEVSVKLLLGEKLDSAMEWLDEENKKERGLQ